MRIGNLHITWLSSRQQQILQAEVRDELRLPEVKNSIARLARSEVKNYLAELAEKNEMPFGDAGSFLAYVRAAVATAGAHELERRIFPTDESREQVARNLKLVDAVFNPEADLADEKTWDQILSDEFEEVGPPKYPFEVGGYANHPEQKEYDSLPFPPDDPHTVIRNLKLSNEENDDVAGA